MSWSPSARRDHLADRQAERLREREVALVVRRHGHDGAGAVVDQHVVGDPDLDPLVVDRVDDVAAGEHAGLGLVGVASGRRPTCRRCGARSRSTASSRSVPRTRSLDQRVLGRQHEEGGAEQRVGARREDGDVDRPARPGRKITSAPCERPIQLRCMVSTRSGHDSSVVHVVQQPVGVVGDPEEPLLESAHSTAVPQRSQRPSMTCSLASTVWSLRAPVDRRPRAGRPARARTAAGRSTASSGSSSGSAVEISRVQSIDQPIRCICSRIVAMLRAHDVARAARRCGWRRSRPAGRTRRSPSGAAPARRCGARSARRRRPSCSSRRGPCAGRPTGTAASRARSCAGARRSPDRRGSASRTRARRPTPPASGSRSRRGRSARSSRGSSPETKKPLLWRGSARPHRPWGRSGLAVSW